MRKKWLPVAAGFGLGAVMLLSSGYSAMAGTSGYDAYKTAVKNTKTVQSMTSHVDMTVTDNGTKVLSGTAVIKMNHKLQTMSMSGSMNDGKQTHEMQAFRQDGKMIFKSGDQEEYRVVTQNAAKWQHQAGTDAAPGMPKAAEQVVDALMGNIRNLATVENESDGSKQAELHLSGSQIPAVVNALGSLVASKAGSGDWEHKSWKQDAGASHPSSEWHPSLPKLTDHIQVEQINFDAKINPDQILERQTAEISITGTDDTGKKHDLSVQIHIGLSDYNQTTPDRVDLTGKPIKEMQSDGPKRGWHH
ncbi:hypothetical protein RJP21_25765 [Paenibacillus sp. VCA1]|uniref:hypothetical protein n=1 Tax=Paenibacillus sp. VCA1 TaxID=3039148 RepID=UPI00287129AB|nr:hypothetical protein [Paenibacillus sp. VCA1]MDR9857006.1 hypothetical protein [Paenibacillus sp. VCA1]